MIKALWRAYLARLNSSRPIHGKAEFRQPKRVKGLRRLMARMKPRKHPETDQIKTVAGTQYEVKKDGSWKRVTKKPKDEIKALLNKTTK